MRFGLAAARLAASGWVGAAALFVVTAVREVTYPGFDSATKDALALLRFPLYYAFGFAMLAVAVIGSLLAIPRLRPEGNPPGAPRTAQFRRAPFVNAACLLMLALGIMVVDYFSVYRPMAAMIDPPGGVHNASFESYHHVSVWLNTAQLVLCAVAALLLCGARPCNISEKAANP